MKIDCYNNAEMNIEFQIGNDLIINGASNNRGMTSETFGSVLCRYMEKRIISIGQLAEMTGWSKSVISRYCKESRNIKCEKLSVICIVLRLYPCEQRYLFSLAGLEMPAEKILHNERTNIVRWFLDGCAYDEQLSLDNCNKMMKENGFQPLA